MQLQHVHIIYLWNSVVWWLQSLKSRWWVQMNRSAEKTISCHIGSSSVRKDSTTTTKPSAYWNKNCWTWKHPSQKYPVWHYSFIYRVNLTNTGQTYAHLQLVLKPSYWVTWLIALWLWMLFGCSVHLCTQITCSWLWTEKRQK